MLFFIDKSYDFGSFCIFFSTFLDLVSECLCPLRLYIKQEKYPWLKSHLDKLMDHNDDVTNEEVRKIESDLNLSHITYTYVVCLNGMIV